MLEKSLHGRYSRLKPPVVPSLPWSVEYSLSRGEMQPVAGTAEGSSDWSWRVDFKMQALMLD